MALDKKDKEYIEETFSRYAKVIDEDNQTRLRPIAEMVGQNSTDITEIKENLKNKPDVSRVAKIEADIKILQQKIV